MIHWLDCDLKGYSAVQKLVDSGKVKRYVCDSFEAYQRYCRELRDAVTPADLVVADTFNSLLETARFDARYVGIEGFQDEEDLWAKRGIDDPYGRSYDVSTKFSLKWLKNLSARGARIITVCHEAEVRDDSFVPPMKRRGPDVNDKFVNTLIGASSDLYRMEQLTEPITRLKEDGSGDVETIAQVDDRIIYLRSQPHFRAKYSCDVERSPSILRGMINPTLPKLYEHLGCQPPWITLYGPSGVGKTTFALSEAA